LTLPAREGPQGKRKLTAIGRGAFHPVPEPATSRACARTTGPRTRTSRYGGESARCSASNHLDQRSAFSAPILRFTTPSTSSAISYPAARSVCFGQRRGMLGKARRQLRVNLVGALARFKPVNVTVPFAPLLCFSAAGERARARSDPRSPAYPPAPPRALTRHRRSRWSPPRALRPFRPPRRPSRRADCRSWAPRCSS
jgi:hypothetical protein